MKPNRCTLFLHLVPKNINSSEMVTDINPYCNITINALVAGGISVSFRIRCLFIYSFECIKSLLAKNTSQSLYTKSLKIAHLHCNRKPTNHEATYENECRLFSFNILQNIVHQYLSLSPARV